MIRDLKPYTAYKDSGVQWLGDVPEHWQVSPSRVLFKEIMDQNHPDEALLSVTISRGVISQSDLLSDTSKKDSSNLDKSKYKLIQPGDIAYNKMRAWQGAVGASRLQGIISPAYIVQRPRDNVLPEYMHYLLRTPSFATEAERWSYGITSDQWSLRAEHFKMIYCSLPSWDEQTAIVRFLHYADRQIRKFIVAKHKLIKLLDEQKQGIIHRAVTRGLDPGVPMKPSGVEWLGDVPTHWDVKPLKYFVPQVTVGIVIQPARLYVEAGIPCLRSLNISSGSIEPNNLVFISPESNARHRKSQIHRDDIVVVRTGQAGVAAIVTQEFDGANCIDLLIVRRSERVLSDYLLTYLNSWSARTDVRYRSVGAIQAHYNTATLANLVVPAPPIVEQRKILDDLSSQLSPLIESTRIAEREVSLLREYRTRLIADVVTGKLDVQEAAERLPDETKEYEELTLADEALEDSDRGELTSEELAEEVIG